jgi:hypothetical protein
MLFVMEKGGIGLVLSNATYAKIVIIDFHIQNTKTSTIETHLNMLRKLIR